MVPNSDSDAGDSLRCDFRLANGAIIFKGNMNRKTGIITMKKSDVGPGTCPVKVMVSDGKSHGDTASFNIILQ